MLRTPPPSPVCLQVVVEAASATEPDAEFHFIRIAHLSAGVSHTDVDEPAGSTAVPWRIGPFGASPIAQRGSSATFSNFSIGPLKKGTHDPNLSDDCGVSPTEADEGPAPAL